MHSCNIRLSVLRSFFRFVAFRGPGSIDIATRGRALSCDGVEYLPQKTVQSAAKKCPSLAATNASSHVLRHTCATHFLRSGVDIAVIALWLSQEGPGTNHTYLQANLAT